MGVREGEGEREDEGGEREDEGGRGRTRGGGGVRGYVNEKKGEVRGEGVKQ